MPEEHRIWRAAMEAATPGFFGGVAELLAEFRRRGGKVAVVSHSEADIIAMNYAAHPAAAAIRRGPSPAAPPHRTCMLAAPASALGP